MERFCKEKVVGPPSRFGLTAAGHVHLVAYELDEDRGSPVVHGFTGGGRIGARGEYSLIANEGQGLFAARDGLGTRPLYVNEDGSIIASDHRFFDGPCTLLPNGARYDVDSGEVTRASLTITESECTLEDCAKELASLLTDSVNARVEGRRKVAVSFSGGLDSSIIALIAAKSVEVVLCSAYAAGSRDEEQARRAAESLDLEVVAVEVDAEMARRELESMDLPFVPTPMDKALWCIYSVTAREAAVQGAELIMLGQLADELFGGYMKYARAAGQDERKAAEMMLTDVLGSGERAFIRDEAACARFTEARFPFTDGRLASFALGIPVRFKVAGEERKVVLRRAAAMLGLPEDLIAAPKKAAQYSSGVAKLIR